MTAGVDADRPALRSRQWWTAGSRAADVALLAVVLIAGSVSRHAVYTGYGVTILVGCVVALALALHRDATGLPSRAALVLALAGTLVAQIIKPPYMNVEDRNWALRAGVLVAMAVTVLVAGVLIAPAARRAALTWTALAGTGLAYTLVVAGGKPLIDVYAIIQGASLGVVHGRNPYDMVFTGVPAGQVDDCFNYLPMTFLLPIPSRLLTGEVRYAEAAALFAGVAALVWYALRSGRGGTSLAAGLAPALALLAGVVPGSLYDVQQAWNETIVFGGLAGAAVLVAVRRPWWAVVCLAVALATKQHVVLLLPLWALWPAFGWRRAVAAGAGAGALMAPWVLWDFSRFWHCVVDFFLDLPARQDSLSVWKHIPDGLGTVVLLLLAATAYLIVGRAVPRTEPGGLLLGSGLVLAAFDLVNKQSFLNQWLLAGQLVLAGMALVAATRANAGRDQGAPIS